MSSCNTPIMDLLMFDTYNIKLLAIGDASQYPLGFTVNTPTIQITPPGFIMKSNAFVAGSVQVYNGYTLGITPDDSECNLPNLPDGIYTATYSFAPANVYSVTKSFLRVAQLYSDMDNAFLKLELMECDGVLKREKKLIIDDIEFYAQGAIAASNKCALKLSTDLYNKARKMLDQFVQDLNCCSKTW